MSATPRTDAVAEVYVSHRESNWSDLLTHAERLEVELNAARIEIERIKQNIGCARGQTTTQFCAEVVALRSKVSHLIEDAYLEGFDDGHCAKQHRPTSTEYIGLRNEGWDNSRAAKRKDRIK